MRKYITISAVNKEEANNRLLRYGANIFSVPLSVTGNNPPTHYGCCWDISEVEQEDVTALTEGIGIVMGDDFGAYIQIPVEQEV